MQVYVLNKHGQPLMPCSPAKARRLLEADKAKVIKRTPFTIQLLYGSTGYKQPVILGVDAGSKTIGMSASTRSIELFAEEVIPRNDVVKNLSTRREFRRGAAAPEDSPPQAPLRPPGPQQAQGLAGSVRGGQDPGACHRHPEGLLHLAHQQGGC